jgi:RND family efflux transporter MFP subunit
MEPAPTEPTVVIVSQPLEQVVPDYKEFSGQTDAAMSVDLRARVSGYLASYQFQPGAEVRKDQVLFEIDPRPYQAVLEQAKASVLSFEASVKRAKADFERAEKLLPKGAVSQEDYDQAVAKRDEAAAGLVAAKARVDEANLNLEFTKITAPFDGQIGRNLIDVGNLVSADVTELGNIVAVDPVFVYFDVDDRTMLKVQQLLLQGKIQASKDEVFPVMIRLDDETEYTHEAMVDFINNRIDLSTGTIRMRGTLPNPVVAHGLRRFASGLHVQVRVPVGPPSKGLLVSERALMTLQGQKHLYVVNDKNEVVDRPVKVGALHDGLRVVEEGLSPGERVITNGLQMVRPGLVVEPKPGPMRPTPEAAPAAASPVQATTTTK